jgi:2-polyprenyl-3-methyl-5-hydroxy-6-metoxy-1,4-benzoquinol methylase
MTAPRWLKAGVRGLVELPIRLMPGAWRRRLVRVVLDLAADDPSPEDAMRAVLEVEGDVDGYVNSAAVRYGGGVHVKHRVTAYHDFFVERVRPGERVLDLGCGYGAVAYSIASRAGAVVVGVDSDAWNIDQARRVFQHANLVFEQGDVLVRLPEGEFDAIVLSNVLEHIEDRTGFLRKVQVRVRPGRWLIRVPMIDRDWRVPLRRELGLPYFSDGTHFTEYTRESFVAEIAAADLDVTELRINWGEIWAEARPRAPEP